MRIREEIEALNADYWLRVDQRSAQAVDELYVDSGVFAAGSLELRGRTAIGEFFVERNRQQAASGRRTRHACVNLHLTEVREDRVVCHATIVVFAGTGALPIEAASPSTVADAEDVCVRGSDGSWRFASRHITPIFVGSGAASFARSPADRR